MLADLLGLHPTTTVKWMREAGADWARYAAERTAKVTDTGITWNYSTVLNITFLLLAATSLVRFFSTGGPAMLRMTSGSPDESLRSVTVWRSPAAARARQPAR